MFSLPSASGRLTRFQQTGLFLGAMLMLSLFIAATLVKPDPNGSGTHQQFGFPPCSFKVVFGIPCPSCGGTTSFAHFVRGQWPSALKANAAGFLLALSGLFFVPWAILSSCTGKLVSVSHPVRSLLIFLSIVSSVAILQWAARIPLR